jgi:hypothetical protein
MIWVSTYLRSLLAVVLIAAAVPKLWNRSALARIIANYRVLPDRATVWLARILPESELVVAAALLAGVPGAAAAAAALFSIFALAIASALVRPGPPIPCGCFGVDDAAPVSRRHLVRTMALTAAAVVTSLPAAGPPSFALATADDMAATLAGATTVMVAWIGARVLRMWRRTLIDAESLS